MIVFFSLNFSFFDIKSMQYHHHHHHHHHHHRISVMQSGHLLTRSGLTYPEVSSNVYHDSFCQSDSSVSLPWVIYFEAFYLHVVSSFSCIPVIPWPILPNIQLTFSWYILFSQTRKWRPSHSGITVSPGMQEMPSLNMPVQRLKVVILPLDLLCSGPVTHSGQILTSG